MAAGKCADVSLPLPFTAAVHEKVLHEVDFESK